MKKIFSTLVTTLVLTLGICLLLYLFVEGIWMQWNDVFRMSFFQRTVWFIIFSVTFVNVGFMTWYHDGKDKEMPVDEEQEEETSDEEVAEQMSKKWAETHILCLYALADTIDFAGLLRYECSLGEKYEYGDSREFDKDQCVMFTEERDLRDRMIGICGTITSDEFAELGEYDRQLIKRQAAAMTLYHSQLVNRCLRYGVLLEKDSDND